MTDNQNPSTQSKKRKTQPPNPKKFLKRNQRWSDIDSKMTKPKIRRSDSNSDALGANETRYDEEDIVRMYKAKKNFMPVFEPSGSAPVTNTAAQSDGASSSQHDDDAQSQLASPQINESQDNPHSRPPQQKQRPQLAALNQKAPPLQRGFSGRMLAIDDLDTTTTNTEIDDFTEDASMYEEEPRYSRRNLAPPTRSAPVEPEKRSEVAQPPKKERSASTSQAPTQRSSSRREESESRKPHVSSVRNESANHQDDSPPPRNRSSSGAHPASPARSEKTASEPTSKPFVSKVDTQNSSPTRHSSTGRRTVSKPPGLADPTRSTDSNSSSASYTSAQSTTHQQHGSGAAPAAKPPSIQTSAPQHRSTSSQNNTPNTPSSQHVPPPAMVGARSNAYPQPSPYDAPMYGNPPPFDQHRHMPPPHYNNAYPSHVHPSHHAAPQHIHPYPRHPYDARHAPVPPHDSGPHIVDYGDQYHPEMYQKPHVSTPTSSSSRRRSTKRDDLDSDSDSDDSLDRRRRRRKTEKLKQQHREEIKQLHEQIRYFKEERENMKRERERIDHERRDFQRKREEHKRKIESKISSIRKERDALNQQRKDIENIQQKQQHLDHKELQQLKDEMSLLRKTHEEETIRLNEQIEHYKINYGKIKVERDNMREDSKSLRNRVAHLEQEIVDLKTQNSDLQDELTHAQKSTAAQQVQIQQQRQPVTHATSKQQPSAYVQKERAARNDRPTYTHEEPGSQEDEHQESYERYAQKQRNPQRVAHTISNFSGGNRGAVSRGNDRRATGPDDRPQHGKPRPELEAYEEHQASENDYLSDDFDVQHEEDDDHSFADDSQVDESHTKAESRYAKIHLSNIRDVNTRYANANDHDMSQYANIRSAQDDTYSDEDPASYIHDDTHDHLDDGDDSHSHYDDTHDDVDEEDEDNDHPVLEDSQIKIHLHRLQMQYAVTDHEQDPEEKPAQLVRRIELENGKYEEVFSNNRRHVLYPNGTIKKIFPNGFSIVLFDNGDVKRTYPTSKIIYYYDGVGTTHTTYPNGLEIFNFGNGQVEKHFPEGTKEITFPDGTCKIILKNGDEEIYFPDGTIQLTLANGEKTIRFPDGHVERS
uniref:Centromere protein J C-terminal domain-containing protein n=1 Tax=Percolomonas cosmopolitus TaxID=63605 RepID=A0A7S1KUS7_9EUKA|mmetsp:Transcript_9646/g.35782  ORF Transcript_9646/g.35782 Transcript_9646/m.35782 type:complete len:1098 (+) Transcript_9646:335-3628(+)|eukprot:CAMPEP_0117435368 /NCGR_PEP_ID=MMETSP0759-20121206/445_1 /TAXON_ID=63605 /ORGANISM="Percolomonas cosmopolitus, Strain WS" /LENGTH=1097 /DNA_ID=CAMNT_0005226913 /DNA_START=239 /DNA_END=3532 /DNA_ORIENTATION=+